MLRLKAVSFSLSGDVIFENISLSATSSDRIALIGDNGSGKTTLLKLIAGELQPDSGAVDRSVVASVRQVISPTAIVSNIFRNAEQWMVERAMEEVGLDMQILNRTFGEISGGQATRVSIAAILALSEAPDFILLDEPTNNLDAEGLEWLVEFLDTFEGGVIVASHDRGFIDNFANKIWSIEGKKVVQTNGNYSTYKTNKDADAKYMSQLYESKQEERRKIKRLIRIATQKSQSASRVQRRDNDKMLYHSKKEGVQKKAGQELRRLTSRERHIEAIDRPLVEKSYGATLLSPQARVKALLSLEDVTKSFEKPDSTIIFKQSLTVYAGRRIILSGRNGSGKTTLLRIIARDLLPTSGRVIVSPSVNVGYFSQDTYELDMTLTPIELLTPYCEDISEAYKRLRTLGVGAPKAAQAKIATLSRGQQAKIGLAKLILNGSDLLVLDEPTNHLDISTRSVMEDMLDRYRGAIIYASHDEAFVNRIGSDERVEL